MSITLQLSQQLSVSQREISRSVGRKPSRDVNTSREKGRNGPCDCGVPSSRACATGTLLLAGSDGGGVEKATFRRRLERLEWLDDCLRRRPARPES